MRLLGALGEGRGAEDLELVGRGQGDALPPRLDLVLDRGEQRAGAGLPLAQQPVLAAQVVVGPGVRVGEDLGNLVSPQLPVEQDMPQAPQVGSEYSR